MSVSKVPKLYDELYDWIDRGPLVEALIAALWEKNLPLTRGQAKLIWYQALEELPGFLARQAERKGGYERRWQKQ
jgi:hypothetical protein